MSGGHSRLDALNGTYANTNIPCDFTYAPIPAGKGMFDLALDSPICPLATQLCPLRLRPREIVHHPFADDGALQFRKHPIWNMAFPAGVEVSKPC
jgi:hypothetical protein